MVAHDGERVIDNREYGQVALGAADVAGVSAVIAYIAVLFATLLIYLYWRMTGGPANWLVLD